MATKLTKAESAAQAEVAACLANTYVQEAADAIAEDHVRRWGYAHDKPTKDKDGRSSVSITWLGAIKGEKHREIAVSVAADEGKPTATAIFRDGCDRREKRSLTPLTVLARAHCSLHMIDGADGWRGSLEQRPRILVHCQSA